MGSIQNVGITPNISLKDVEYNLKIMANTISDEANELDNGFIEIFQNALRNLDDQEEKNQTDVEKIGELSLTLESISNKIKDVATKKSQFEGRKFIGPAKDPKVAAQSLLDGPIKTGLTKLSPYFEMSAIVKDNHCIYRATIAGYLIDKFCKMSKEKQLEEIKRLDELATALSPSLQELFKDNSHNLKEEFKNVKALLEEIMKNPSPEAINLIMNDEKSNCFVKFSRMLASAYYQKNPNNTLEEEAKAFGKDLNTYLRDMATFKKEQWGGNAELVALAKTLGLKIQVTDVCKVGEGQPIYQPNNFFKSDNRTDPRTDILFLQNHYNRGIRKNPMPINCPKVNRF